MVNEQRLEEIRKKIHGLDYVTEEEFNLWKEYYAQGNNRDKYTYEFHLKLVKFFPKYFIKYRWVIVSILITILIITIIVGFFPQFIFKS
jgi:hypothetical protein